MMLYVNSCLTYSLRLLPESTRWLLSRNKDEEARRVLAKAAKINGKDLSPELLKGLQDDPAMKGTRQYTFIDCVRTWNMARLSLNVWFNWSVWFGVCAMVRWCVV